MQSISQSVKFAKIRDLRRDSPISDLNSDNNWQNIYTPADNYSVLTHICIYVTMPLYFLIEKEFKIGEK